MNNDGCCAQERRPGRRGTGRPYTLDYCACNRTRDQTLRCCRCTLPTDLTSDKVDSDRWLNDSLQRAKLDPVAVNRCMAGGLRKCRAGFGSPATWWWWWSAGKLGGKAMLSNWQVSMSIRLIKNPCEIFGWDKPAACGLVRLICWRKLIKCSQVVNASLWVRTEL